MLATPYLFLSREREDVVLLADFDWKERPRERERERESVCE